MAPKKKAGKGGKGKKKSDKQKKDDSLEPPLSEATKSKIRSLELDKRSEEVQRSYAQLERDKIAEFGEITKRRLDDAEATCRNKDREMDLLEERKYMEIQIYRQKVKHVLYENQSNIENLKTDMQSERTLTQQKFRSREAQLLEQIDQLKMQKKEQELSHEHFVSGLSNQHSKELEKLRKEYQLEMSTAMENSEKKMANMRQEMAMQKKRDIHEVEERKNHHIETMMTKHTREYENMRYYYNDIISNNLDLIKALKEDITMMKQAELRSDKLMCSIVTEKKQMAVPLAKALKEVESLRQKLGQYNKDKVALSRTRARHADSEKKLKSLEFEHEVVQQRFEKLQKDRDQIYAQFESAVYKVQQRAGLRELINTRKVERLKLELEKRESQLAECLLAAELDPEDTNKVNLKLEDVLNHKNRLIQQLRLDIAKVSKAHNDLIKVYEAKLVDYGIQPNDLGFRPLLTNTSKNPAGLVSAD
ncbi:hypothetical protein BSKO_11094 [Bryopsis sp. KO-2023]|nr:hypothetical protein BSKO_11094 [Bryopsis sp. KO-2023]